MTAAAAAAVPHDVADDQRDTVPPRGSMSYQSPPDRACSRRVCTAPPRRAGPARAARGEQAALQDVGDLVLGLVQPGPVERLRALAGHGEQSTALVRRPATGRAPSSGRTTARRPRPPCSTAPAAPRPGAPPHRPATPCGRPGQRVRGVQRRRGRAACGPRARRSAPGAAPRCSTTGPLRRGPPARSWSSVGDLGRLVAPDERGHDGAELLGGPPGHPFGIQQTRAVQGLGALFGEGLGAGPLHGAEQASGGTGGHEGHDAESPPGGEQRQARQPRRCRAGPAPCGGAFVARPCAVPRPTNTGRPRWRPRSPDPAASGARLAPLRTSSVGQPSTASA